MFALSREARTPKDSDNYCKPQLQAIKPEDSQPAASKLANKFLLQAARSAQ